MKYLFYVHSGITLQVSLKLIEAEQIQHKDCVFIIARFRPDNIPPNISVCFIEEYFDVVKDFDVSLFIFKPLMKTILFIRLLKNLTDRSFFKAYIPQHSLNIINIITNSKSCMSFSYLEEGTMSYIPVSSHHLTNKLIKRSSVLIDILFELAFLGKVPREKELFLLGHSKLNCFYAISKYCFPDITEHKKILDLPFEHVECSEVNNVLVVEPYVECGLLSFEQYKLCLIKFFDFFDQEGVNSFHFKYHPKQSIEIKELLTELLVNRTAIEIKDNIILENVMFTHKPSIYHINSSIGLYGNLMNCKIYSLIQYVEESVSPIKFNSLPIQLQTKVIYIK